MPNIDNNLGNLALAERGGGMCDAGSRLPTSRYPAYATGGETNIAIGETEAAFEFPAERDILFTDLSAIAELADGTRVPAVISVTYCNTTYMAASDLRVWAYCCQRKPLFLVGVKENKKLRITVTLRAPNAAIVSAKVDLSGFQGSGCCD